MTAPDPVADLARLEREMEEAVMAWCQDHAYYGDTVGGGARKLAQVARVIAARRALVAQGYRQVWLGPDDRVTRPCGCLHCGRGVIDGLDRRSDLCVACLAAGKEVPDGPDSII